jgi:hypothetical protein
MDRLVQQVKELLESAEAGITVVPCHPSSKPHCAKTEVDSAEGVVSDDKSTPEE